MSEEMVLYNDRYVPKKHFRAFIYSYDNAIKLVNSWQEYYDAMSSGLWYNNAMDVPEKLRSKKSKGGD
jgi:hypothetical protein